MHSVLDVSLEEDQSWVCSGYASEGLALLRKLALKLVRKKPVLARKTSRAANSPHPSMKSTLPKSSNWKLKYVCWLL
jgi:hypothetical protein